MIQRGFKKTIYNNVYSQYKPPNNKPQLHTNMQWSLIGVGVYKFVFTTNVAFGAALVLCFSLLLQPFTLAYAQEPDTSTAAASETESALETSTITDADSTTHTAGPGDPQEDIAAVTDNGDDPVDLVSNEQPVNVPETNVQQSSVSTEDDENDTSKADTSIATTSNDTNHNSVEDESSLEQLEIMDTQSQTSVTDTTATTTKGDTVSMNESDLSTVTSTDAASDSSTSTAAQNSTSTQSNSVSDSLVDSGDSQSQPESDNPTSNQNSSTGNESTQDDAHSSTSTQTAEIIASTSTTDTSLSTMTEQSVVVSTVQTDNVLAFNKNECIEVEDGSFYCQKVSYNSLAEDDLFAAPDATGDMEIYVVQNGEQIKVTDNAVDDASPYYDARSETVVWHRLIDDRYQIISYDVQTGVEEQLTNTAVNNMEPTRNGTYTVWQQWVQNNWEIMLMVDDELTQITDSIEHDIAPNIRGDLIIWNVRSSDGTQSLMTYDIGSDTYNEIKDTDGVSVANPRMLVMYEAQYQNGDTVMKGFDLITGEVIPIDRIPLEVPTDIPSPEPTGEVRALPSHSQIEEDQSTDSDIETNDPPNEPDTSDTQDLDLTASSSATSTVDVVTETEYDLDLRPDEFDVASSTDSSVIDKAVIPDVVIPEFPPNDENVNQASSTQQN